MKTESRLIVVLLIRLVFIVFAAWVALVPLGLSVLTGTSSRAGYLAAAAGGLIYAFGGVSGGTYYETSNEAYIPVLHVYRKD